MTVTAPERLSFSVIVASRNRPEWLRRCIRALTQLDHPMFEIVVVADAQSVALSGHARIRFIEFNEANLSAARNLGIRHSGGDICAFIDDDAVPEPMWLWHLEDAFRKTGASAVVGYVRGRNGISFQSRFSSIDVEGETHEEDAPECQPTLPKVEEGRATKLVGTNFAVRRDVLGKVYGFDECFRYFLEDSDLSMRLAQAGEGIAVAPLAEVHHGFAASPRRSRQRAPRDLFDIGRSTAIFLRKHLGTADALLWDRLERREHMRLSRHLVLGTVEPRDVSRRLNELRAGWEDGLDCSLQTHAWRPTTAKFERFPSEAPGHEVFSSYLLSKRRKLTSQANRIASKGGRVSVFSFSLTPFRHHVRYVGEGVWLQTGGLYGRSVRSQGAFKWCRFAERLNAEMARVAKPRGISETTSGKWWDQTRSTAQDCESEDAR